MTTNIELNEIINKLNIPNFKGVFCKDELRHLTVDEKECAIINLDNSTGDGTHWCSYYKDKDNKYYFSSYGDDPPTEVVKYLKPPIHSHTFCIQSFDESICGEYCILFLYLMSKGLLYEDVILFFIE